MSSETSTKTPEAAAVPPPGPAPVRSAVRGRHRRLLTRRDRIMLGCHARHTAPLRTSPSSGSPRRHHRAVLHHAGTASASTPSSGSGCRTTTSCSPSTRSSGPPSAQPHLARRLRPGRRRRSACSSPCCWTSGSASAGSTRPRSSCRSCCRSRVIGFIWQLVYNPNTGLINSLIGANKPGHDIDWLGDPHLNLWAVLIAASWRHAGYVMILYLAGLKARRPVAARGRLAGRRQRVADVQERYLPHPAAHQHRRHGRHRHRVAARLRPGLRLQQGRQRAPNCCRSWSPTTSSASPAASVSARRSPSSCWSSPSRAIIPYLIAPSAKERRA